MTTETTTPEEESANKIGKTQITRVFMTPDLEAELYNFHESFQFFSQVSLQKRSDGSHTFIAKTNIQSTASRAILHYLVAFCETQIRKNKTN
jgi:hypothetical protein